MVNRLHHRDPMGQDAGHLRGERRCALRYGVAVPIDLEDGFGTTQDVSENGVRFVSQRQFTIGQPVRFTLGFRNLPDGQRTLRVSGVGHVVRVESGDARAIVALAVDEYNLPAL